MKEKNFTRVNSFFAENKIIPALQTCLSTNIAKTTNLETVVIINIQNGLSKIYFGSSSTTAWQPYFADAVGSYNDVDILIYETDFFFFERALKSKLFNFRVLFCNISS